MDGINDNVMKIAASEFEISHYNFFERVHLILVLFLFLIMSTDKMKGLLKGLRYISNIFEAEDKEPEMQIGFPTDVKHVAHIGWDDYSMNVFKSESPERHVDTTVGARSAASISPKSHSQDAQHNNEARTSFGRDLPAVPLPKSSKHNPPSSANPTSHRHQHSRRHQSSSKISSDRDTSESSRRGRREHNMTTGGDITQYGASSSSALQDQSVVVPKQARRRKEKGSSSSSGTSSRSSRSKEQQLPLLKPMREEEEKEEG